MANDEHKYQNLSLSENESDSLLFEVPSKAGRKKTNKRRLLKAILLVLVGLLVYTAFVVIATQSISDTDCLRGPLVPKNILREVIRYTPQSYVDHDKEDHPFFGKPSEKLDQN